MRLKYFLICLPVLWMTCSSSHRNRIDIRIPSAQEEAEYIWRTLQDLPFFEKNNYTVALPSGGLINELKIKAIEGKLSPMDYGRLEQFVIDNVYHEADYRAGYEKIKSAQALIEQMIGEINPALFDWSFHTFEVYQVNLTLYGPGGSYDPEEGSILIFTTPEGQFKQYDNPANTIIHEVVHIGIEDSIVTVYKVPHALKERIVDTFVSLHFGNYLPDYRIQNMGDQRTDDHLTKVEDFKNLHHIVEGILN